MGIEKKVFISTLGDGGFFLDSRYFPMLIVGWVGMPSVELIDRFYAARAPFTAHAEGTNTKVMSLTDISKMSVPTAIVRKYISEKNIEVDSKLTCIHGYVTVIPSSIMRGVVTAISWLNSAVNITNVPTPEAGIAEIMKQYQSLGISCERPDATYKVPEVKL